jgi:GT2 family glycosyltransferase
MTDTAIAVVVTCFNLGRTLDEALGSVRHQTRQPDELVVVDDGSDDVHTQQVLARIQTEGVTVIRTGNRGVSAARNLGIASTRAPLVVCLDADDVLDPAYLEKASARLSSRPDLDFVSCGMRGFGAAEYTWTPPQPELVEGLTRGVVHNASMLRRTLWERVGGFDEAIPGSEDLDFWTTVLEHGGRGEVIEEPLLDYRVRPESRYHADIQPERHRRVMAAFYDKHHATVERHALAIIGAKEAFIVEQQEHVTRLEGRKRALEDELNALNDDIRRVTRDLERAGLARVDWGELRRVTPLSPDWGSDRGRPLDRYYIENFLARHRDDIRGRVLEIKDPGYTRMFGGARVTASDVLDVDAANPLATIVVDLSAAHTVPSDAYDCFILTQTLNVLYDVRGALFHAHRVLKPGGVLLCTVAAAGRISYEDGGLDGDYWRFTEASLRRLFAERFPVGSFEVQGYGNVLAGAAFLYGLAAHELTNEELDATDPYFPLTYCIRARKGE